MIKLGLREKQEHKAAPDVRDLIKVLSQKHEGGLTYLALLLGQSEYVREQF
jgi:hypothetical protein